VKKLLIVTVGAVTLIAAGCSKKVALKTPPPVAPQPTENAAPAAPVAAKSTAPATPATVTRSNMPDQATRNRIQELIDRLQDAYFDYNKHSLRPDAEKSLVADAHDLSDILRQYPNYKLTVEGYCDERGSEEYNLALGDKRAEEAKEYLVSLGVPAAQLKTISYGKDRPVCTEHTETCWQMNRRAHITQGG
jgi:peptidoglycan-associated lipoprotein